jgi:SAM-dependent methyltransferase
MPNAEHGHTERTSMTSSCSLINWWNRAPADWADNEQLCQPLYATVLDALALNAGARLLDVGCGAGTALRAAADRGLRTAGVDTAEELLRFAATRLPEADLRVGDLCTLPFADDRFDAVTLFNALQYAADPVTALQEARRSARAHAPVVAVTWAEPGRCESRSAIAAMRSLVPASGAGPQPGGGSFGLSDPGRLAEVFATAGLRVVSWGDLAVSFRYPDLQTATRVQLASGPAQRTLATAGEPAVRAALAEAMQGSRQADGSFRQDNIFQYVIGRS